MFMKVSTLPYSLAYYLLDTACVINESYAHRTDNLSDSFCTGGMLTDILCNNVSCLSSISAVQGSEFCLPSLLYLQNFMGS